MPHRLLLVSLACAASYEVARAQSPIVFTDATAASGILDVGLSFGVSAGDLNDDGLVDLFAGGHYTGHPHLWLNIGNGQFTDVTFALQPRPTGDLHAAQFVDLDGDGPRELVLLRGANYGLSAIPKFVYRGFTQGLVDIAPNLGLDVPLMRARTPIAGDFNGDGDLDLFFTAMQRGDGLLPPAPYLRNDWPGYGSAWSQQPAWLNGDCTFAVLADLDGDRQLDMLLPASPLRAMRFGDNGLSPLPSAHLPPIFGVHDAAVGDFDGDGENEIYLARDADRTSLHQDTPNELQFCAIVSGQEHAVSFPAAAGQKLRLQWGPLGKWTADDVHIGIDGSSPTGEECTLDAADPLTEGHPGHAAGQTRGIHVWRDAATGLWTIAVSSPVWDLAMVRITSDAPIGPVTPIGWNANAPCPGDLLLDRVNGHYVDATAQRGLPPGLRGRSVVAADFDHDMDLDLYVVTTTTTANTPNVLLVNQGNGTFAPQAVLGDAAGTSAGIGDSVITLDHDLDGDLDLFVVNGDASDFRPAQPVAFGDDGPAQLLRNDTANGNHWLAIDLRGLGGNREAIGARVEVTAGGRTQVREHGGGMHRYAQNHGLHFGLGPNTVASRVEVFWPDGTRSVRTGVAADQRFGIVQ